MILPYKVADSVHTHGWTVPFDRYVQLLYGVKSWLFDIDVTMEGSGTRHRVYGSMVLEHQRFWGGATTWDTEYNTAQQAFSLPATTAATRRLVHPAISSTPLLYDALDAPLAAAFPDKKYITATMWWASAATHVTGGESPSLNVHFEAFNEEGVYDTDDYTYEDDNIFCLPCAAHPLLWQPDHTASPVYACGFNDYGTSDMLVYLPGPGNVNLPIINVTSIFGSTDNLDIEYITGSSTYLQGESTALDLQIDGRPVTATNSLLDYPFVSGYAYLTVNEWW